MRLIRISPDSESVTNTSHSYPLTGDTDARLRTQTRPLSLLGGKPPAGAVRERHQTQHHRHLNEHTDHGG